MHYYFITVRWLPRWQNRCYRASHELCSGYLLLPLSFSWRWVRSNWKRPTSKSRTWKNASWPFASHTTTSRKTSTKSPKR